jgi:DNA-binding GntR family transcriptional regulator
VTDEHLETRAGAFRESLKTIEERAQSFIRDAILRGEYKPGERLRQGELATLLGVSRMPVRASLRKLEAEGLVEIRPKVGAIVRALQPEQVVEIYELRIMLETYLLRHAAARLTPQRLEKIGGELGRQGDAAAGTPGGWGRRHSFYHSLYEFADRPRALELADRLRLAVGRYLLQQRIDEYSDAHLQLLDRLRVGDVDSAVAMLEEHLSKVSVQLQLLLRSDAEQQLPAI